LSGKTIQKPYILVIHLTKEKPTEDIKKKLVTLPEMESSATKDVQATFLP